MGARRPLPVVLYDVWPVRQIGQKSMSLPIEARWAWYRSFAEAARGWSCFAPGGSAPGEGAVAAGTAQLETPATNCVSTNDRVLTRTGMLVPGGSVLGRGVSPAVR